MPKLSSRAVSDVRPRIRSAKLGRPSSKLSDPRNCQPDSRAAEGTRADDVQGEGVPQLHRANSSRCGLRASLTLVHTPSQIVVLGDEILRKVPGQILAPLEMVAEECYCKMGHAGPHPGVENHHVIWPDE